ncbi:MAG: class I SAM-dependent methyltransferase [Sphingomonadaceae bacterium]
MPRAEDRAFAARLAAAIEAEGPLTLGDYMARCNAHYYGTRDPLGAKGDFITAPEISQMFGELIGIWFADLWRRAGAPGNARYVELGPGRGTLAADALGAMRAARFEPPVDLVETSALLRGLQREALGGACWHDGADTLPENAPLLVVANEFFDALPVRQYVLCAEGWRERRVGHRDGGFAPLLGEPLAALPFAPPASRQGAVYEHSPAREALMRALAGRLARQGGAALIVDYGHEGHAAGDSFQAVRGHGYADPFLDPGGADLTAHVDFAALEEAAREEDVRVHGPRSQGEWLTSMGIALRAASLAKASPERAEELAAARERLTGPGQMGRLFKVLALTHREWPEPEGF